MPAQPADAAAADEATDAQAARRRHRMPLRKELAASREDVDEIATDDKNPTDERPEPEVAESAETEPATPRRRWKNSLLKRGVDAECSRWFRPWQRSPVSSRWTTWAALMWALIWARNSVRSPAARAVTAATVPSDTGMPNSSVP